MKDKMNAKNFNNNMTAFLAAISAIPFIKEKEYKFKEEDCGYSDYYGMYSKDKVYIYEEGIAMVNTFFFYKMKKKDVSKFDNKMMAIGPMYYRSLETIGSWFGNRYFFSDKHDKESVKKQIHLIKNLARKMAKGMVGNFWNATRQHNFQTSYSVYWLDQKNAGEIYALMQNKKWGMIFLKKCFNMGLFSNPEYLRACCESFRKQANSNDNVAGWGYSTNPNLWNEDFFIQRIKEAVKEVPDLERDQIDWIINY